MRRENSSIVGSTSRQSGFDPEKMKLQEDLLRAKENLNVVVQEMIYTENQLAQREQEIRELKSKLAKQNDTPPPLNLRTLLDKNKVLESTLQSKDKVYNEMMDDLKRKIVDLQGQLDEKEVAEHQAKAEKVVDRLSVVLQKENSELKRLLAESKDKIATMEQNFLKEKNAYEEQFKAIVSQDLTPHEKQQLGQSLFGNAQTTEERLSQSLSITNTVKLLGHSKEQIRFYETENANLRLALIEVAKEYETEKEDWERQMNDLRKVIYDLNNKIRDSQSNAILEYVEELKRENISLRNSLAKTHTVKESSSLESARSALQQESKRLDEMMSTPQFLLSSMLSSDIHRSEEEEEIHAERNMIYDLQVQNQKLKDEKELLYVRIQDLEYHAAVMENQKLDLQQDVLQLAKERDRFQLESVIQARKKSPGETTPNKGILKPEPTIKYSDAVNRVNNLLKKVGAKNSHCINI